MPKIVVQEGQKQRVFEYDGGRVTFGQSKAVIPLSSQGVSDLHCEISDTPEGFRLKDLKSKQGTKLNGKSVSTAYLRDGDEVQIGKAKITFWEEEVGDSVPVKSEKKAGKRSEKRSEKQSETNEEDDGERPRRPRRSSSGKNPFIIVISLLIGVGIIILFFFGTQFYFQGQAQVEILYATGLSAYGRGEYQKAIDCFSQIDPNYPTYGSMAQEKYKEAQIKKAKAETGAQLRELKADLYRIFNYKADSETVKSKLKEWIQAHASDSPALAKEAQDEIDRLEQNPTYSEHDRRRDPEEEQPNPHSTPGTPEEELAQVLSQINPSINQKKYKEAIDPLNEFKQKYPLNTKLRRQADEKIEAIYKEAQTQYQKIIDQVHTFASQGKKQEAKKEIQQIINSFGLDFYVAQAKEELKKLD